MNRYIVSKGWEGFGDRLQCLSYSINIALLYNRILCVDWKDRIWSHDGSDFFRYFTLVDLPYVTSTEHIPQGLDIFPKFWRNGLGLSPDEWVYKLKDDLIFDPKEGNHCEAVWVHSGIGFRAYDFNQLVRHLRFSTETMAEIQPIWDKVPRDMPVVHLRGTDRTVPKEQWETLRKAAPVACVLSDDAKLVELWLNDSPQSVVLSDTLVQGEIAGHKLEPCAVTQLGITKHQMNIRLLVDFLILASAHEAYALNDDSLFFSMARVFGSCGGVKALFQLAPDAEKCSTYRTGYHFEYRDSEIGFVSSST